MFHVEQLSGYLSLKASYVSTITLYVYDNRLLPCPTSYVIPLTFHCEIEHVQKPKRLELNRFKTKRLGN